MVSPSLTLESPVSKIPFVGHYMAARLNRLEVFTVKDLLYLLPWRYDDFSLISPIGSLQEGETVTIQGKVLEIKNEYTRGGFVLQKAKVQDSSGTIDVVWFNQTYLPKSIHADDLISLSGKIKRQGKKLQLSSPKYELLSGGDSIHTGRLVPVYSESNGLTSKWIRNRLSFLVEEIKANRILIDDSVDESIINNEKLMPLKDAIVKIHFPKDLDEAKNAHTRLAFNELLFAQIQSISRKQEWEKHQVGNKIEIEKIRNELKKVIDGLPFKLTSSQNKVIKEIYDDLASDKPMNRLLQGDVGSGKTVVAALAMAAVFLNGYQSVLMAPTEILAFQHYQTLNRIFSKTRIKIGIATRSKKEFLDSDVLVGTHALLSDKISINKLGLVVIDEQHRFGVGQRSLLSGKGNNPHVLTMTATPIPRTVALTIYKDLDLSILDEMPKNRLPVKTWVVPKEKRDSAYKWIRNQQTQTFIICPLIEESETLITVKSSKAEFNRLAKEIFPDLKLGLLHGKLKTKEKDSVLKDFRDQKLDILVATPVVEVGIDIPTASIMLIEAADRFGLAQLHQLRGRVGRGEQQSYCLLFTESEETSAISRLKYLEKLNNGLKLAETDLKFRGPGQRFGTAQHGRWDLKIATFDDLNLADKTTKLAKEFLERPKVYPSLLKSIEESKIEVAPN